MMGFILLFSVVVMPSISTLDSRAFPYALGSDGAGTVVRVGDEVSRFAVSDRVYAYSFLNPKGSFYSRTRTPVQESDQR